MARIDEGKRDRKEAVGPTYHSRPLESISPRARVRAVNAVHLTMVMS